VTEVMCSAYSVVRCQMLSAFSSLLHRISATGAYILSMYILNLVTRMTTLRLSISYRKVKAVKRKKGSKIERWTYRRLFHKRCNIRSRLQL